MRIIVVEIRLLLVIDPRDEKLKGKNNCRSSVKHVPCVVTQLHVLGNLMSDSCEMKLCFST